MKVVESGHSHKILPLEALRGLAAIVVLLDHFFAAFVPSLQPRLIGTPFYVCINGYAAVMVFFILSGYVLSLKGHHPNAPAILAETGLKRWFRLTPLVCFSTILSYALFRLGLYHFQDAAHYNTSDYLKTFGTTGLPQTYRPDFSAALYQGTLQAFLSGSSYLNTNLWTMQWEFFGSFLVLGLAMTLKPEAGNLLWWLLSIICMTLIFFFPSFLWCFPFFLGLFAASIPLRELVLNKPTTLVLLAIGFYLCGYYDAEGSYLLFSRISYPPVSLLILILSSGGFALFIVFATQNFVSLRFRGAISYALGSASFSMYLVHTLVFMSFSAWAYAALKGGWIGVIGAAAAGGLVMAPLVWAMSCADSHWLRYMSKIRFPFLKKAASQIEN